MALTALLTEIAFRVVQGYRPSFIFPTASYGQFRPPPGTEIFGHAVNSQGFQDVERQRKKDDGVQRIVGIGDSFVFGVVPQPDNFLALLERDLRQQHDAVEVINLGIPRTGVADYRSLLVNEGLSYDPDLVLVFFYMGNDFRMSKPVQTRSYLWDFLRYVFRIWPRHGGQVQMSAEYVDDAATFRDGVYLELRARQLGQFRSERPPYRRAFERLVGTLEEMSQFCSSAGARMAVVLIPDELQVYDDLRLRVAGSEIGSYNVERPHRKMLAALTAKGIPTIDLLPSFRAANDQVLYKPRDTHWNLLGNRLAADELARRLAADGWLEQQTEPRATIDQ